MQNPFTTTFSRIPDYSYIETEQVDIIVDNFRYENPSESVYKITGVRGSGKTVLLAKIEEALSTDENRENGWLVYRLSPARDMIRQLAALLYKESFIKKQTRSKSINVSANVFGTGGGVGIAREQPESMFDIGIELDRMIEEAGNNSKKILIGIDEVSKTPQMGEFASEYGKWLREGYKIYLVCTGLYENIEQLSNVKNLTFFRRATTIKTEPLNVVRMSEMYKYRLEIDSEHAIRYAQSTKGYPYAFQELGVLAFNQKCSGEKEDIVHRLKTELYSYAYEKIWEELSPEDRKMAGLLAEKDDNKREDVMKRMEKPNNYSVYRDRLLKRGIITSKQGYISLALPYFGEYMKEYCGM